MSDTTSMGKMKVELILDAGEVFEDFIMAVHELENTLAETRAVFSEGDLSVSDWVVLRNIPSDEEIRLGLLARRTGLSRQRLNKLILGLSDAMLIEVRVQTGDARARLVKVTPTGKKALASISKQMRGFAEEMAGNTKPEVLQRFTIVAKRIVKTMAAKPGKAAA